MTADVAKGCCTKKSIDYSVDNGISVLVAGEAAIVRNSYTAKDERSGGSEGVNIVAEADVCCHSIINLILGISLLF